MSVPRRKPAEVDEAVLLRALQQEETDAATYFDSELASAQADAIDRYFARPYRDGSEVPNRSTIVTRDVQDAINWIIPHILRHLVSSEELISVDDEALDDGDQVLTDAASWLRYVLFNDNPGEQILHDYLWDGLVTRAGVLRTAWEQPEDEPPRVIEGLDSEQYLRYATDPRYEILSQEVDWGAAGEPMDVGSEPVPQEIPAGGGLMSQVGPPAGGGMLPAPVPTMLQPQSMQPTAEPSITIEVRRRRSGKVLIEAVAPENFRISRRAKSIATAPYHAGVFEQYLVDVIRDYPDRAAELDPNTLGASARLEMSNTWSDPRLFARFGEEADTSMRAGLDQIDERRRVVVMVEYIRGDFDRDGTAELRCVKRVGDVILEQEIVRDSEFSLWSPIRVAHRAIGMSIADTLLDIQRIRTVLTRSAMDGLSQSLAPRMLVNSMAIANDETLIDQLLDHDVGDVIPVAGNPRDVAMPLVTPDLSAPALQWSEYWQQRGEEASGWTRHNMGVQPKAITDTAQGIESLQAAANSRVEQYARWAAEGIQDALNRALRLTAEYQDQERQIKVRGRKLRIDPRRWSDEMTATVHVGGVESRQQRLQHLAVIASKQEQILLQLGPNNPLVTLRHYRNTLAKIMTAMGEKDASAFVAEIPEDWQPPPPGPDAKVMEAQGKLQLDQAKASHVAELEKAKLAHDAQMKEAEFQRDVQLQAARLGAEREKNAAELEHRRQVAMLDQQNATAMQAQKLEAETAIATAKLQTETMLARQRMANEMALAEWKTAQELKLRREQGAVRGTSLSSGVEDDVSDDVRFGGRVG